MNALFVLAYFAFLFAAPAADHQSKSSPGDNTVLYVQILIAVIGSLMLPIIFYALNRGKAITDKLKEQADTNKAELRAVELNQFRQDLKEYKTELRKTVARFEELQRSYDRHPLECQKVFVTNELFHREQAASKEYVKLLYAAIKQHLAKLENELDSDDGNGV